jgi:hypothetical protein
MGQVHQKNRQRRLVHLDSVPIGRTIQPHVLRPVPVRLLGSLQIGEHAAGVLVRAGASKPPAVSTMSRDQTRW